MQEKPAKAKGRGKTGKQHKAKGDGNNDEQKQEAKDGGKNDEQKHEAKGGCKNDEQKHEAKGAGDEQKHEAKGGRENDEQKHEAKGAGDEQKHEAKGGGKNDEQKHELKRKLSVFLDDRSLSTPPATAKEAPGSDPLQKKAKAPRKGKGKGSKRASTGKGRGLEKAEDAEVPDKSTDNHEQEDSEVLAKSADDDSLLDTADDEPVASPKGAGEEGEQQEARRQAANCCTGSGRGQVAGRCRQESACHQAAGQSAPGVAATAWIYQQDTRQAIMTRPRQFDSILYS